MYSTCSLFFTVFSGILCHNQDHSTAKYGMGIIFLSFFDLKNEASPTHFSYRKNKKKSLRMNSVLATPYYPMKMKSNGK